MAAGAETAVSARQTSPAHGRDVAGIAAGTEASARRPLQAPGAADGIADGAAAGAETAGAVGAGARQSRRGLRSAPPRPRPTGMPAITITVPTTAGPNSSPTVPGVAHTSRTPATTERHA